MDELRTFECTLENGAERVVIEDVIVLNGDICLLVRGLRGGRKYVFQVVPRGIVLSHPDVSRQVQALHEEELCRFAATQQEPVSAGN